MKIQAYLDCIFVVIASYFVDRTVRAFPEFFIQYEVVLHFHTVFGTNN